MVCKRPAQVCLAIPIERHDSLSVDWRPTSHFKLGIWLLPARGSVPPLLQAAPPLTCVLPLQGEEQLWDKDGAGDGTGGERAVHGTGRAVHTADGDVHGHAARGRDRGFDARTVRTRLCPLDQRITCSADELPHRACSPSQCKDSVLDSSSLHACAHHSLCCRPLAACKIEGMSRHCSIPHTFHSQVWAMSM